MPVSQNTQSLSHIEIKGVKTHNLKNLDISIPLYQFTAITGVSGSGKSSLAFDTLYAEAQRRFLETLGTYERQFLQGLPQGDFESIDPLPAAVALKQTNRSSDPRSVVATSADLQESFKLLFSALMDHSCVQCGHSVKVDSVGDVLEMITKNKKNPGSLLTIALELPKETKALQKFLKDLQIEGYTRLANDEDVFEIEELIENPKAIKGYTYHLVLDRFNQDITPDELKNRIETAWSQVKYSNKFSSFHLRFMKKDLKLESFQTSSVFHVQPYCSVCEKQTNYIQLSDLDWQTSLGSCKRCQGMGDIPILDEEKIIPDPSLSVLKSVVKPWSNWGYEWGYKNFITYARANLFPLDKPYNKLSSAEKQILWDGPTGNPSKNSLIGIRPFFKKVDEERYSMTSRILAAKYKRYEKCPDCEGARLGLAGRNAMCGGKKFYDLYQSELRDVLSWLDHLKENKVLFQRLQNSSLKETYNEVHKKITLLCRLGLESVHLFRRIKTLSGGEYQRVLLSRVIGNGLTDALYVLDEPSVGLGSTEVKELVSCLMELRDLGNTVVVVDHDLALINAADHIIELGPKGGEKGGYLLPSNASHQPISAQVDVKLPKPVLRETKKNFWKSEETKKLFSLKGFSALNCKNLDFEFALEQMTVVTGVSGSGKSTLLNYGVNAAFKYLQRHGSEDDEDSTSASKKWDELKVPDKLSSYHYIDISQKPLSRTSTSVPATLLGISDELRKSFASTSEAKERGLTTSDFTFNGKGACQLCKGKGVIQEDLFFLGEVEKECPECKGERFNTESMVPRYLDLNIAQWHKISIEEALKNFGRNVSFAKKLSLASQLGLGHLPLGISTTKISGGEAQRLKILSELAQGHKKIICVLDEPTRGLSEKDIGELLLTLLRLCREEGHTFVIAEHHPLFVQYAHQVIKLGPGSGIEGGKIIERIKRDYL